MTMLPAIRWSVRDFWHELSPWACMGLLLLSPGLMVVAGLCAIAMAC